ncbi:DGQHR domain-containing protein [Daejeonella rubra]|uniref:DGQHR domain-containing protein n=1 Tax=Daejeonella rubra TaxID=990371 RepID=A0A1G9X4J4_9SPHI|nr:DGQHR domain-containing protein [Daejeonella rubra]SDM91253.1 DGQHR domain-containing protein [Daejeonella rubra]
MDQQTYTFQCLKCTQPIGEFYIGVIDHDALIYISYADIRRLETGTEEREVEVYTGIQRELSTKRAKDIGKYVNMVDATFPTGVILHIDPKDIISYDQGTGMMTIPYKDNVAKVLDGQHRIAGLEYYTRSPGSFQVNITIFVGMELEDQAIVFATINKTQTAVNKSLVADLFEFATHRSPQKTAHNIIRALNQKEGSPFKDKIKILGKADDSLKETITQATFAEALMKMFSRDPMSDRDIYKRGNTPLRFTGKDLESKPLRNLFIDKQDGVIAKIIMNYFLAVSQRWPRAWEVVEPTTILNKSTGFIALMNLFKDIYVTFGNVGDVIEVDQFFELFKKVNLSDADFTRENFVPGSSGQSALYKKFKNDMGLI